MDSTTDLRSDAPSRDHRDGFAFEAPDLGEGTVLRVDLLERLAAKPMSRIVSINAPAGFGKTTLLAQWANNLETPCARVSIERTHNDPTVLMLEIVQALDDAGTDVRTFTASETSTQRLISSIVKALESSPAPILLMLDHVERLRSRAANDALATLVARLPDTSRLAIASRRALQIPLSVFRSRGQLLEITSDNLAMNAHEVSELLAGLGVDIGDRADLVQHQTEGWPVAVHLVGVAIASGATTESALDIRGSDHYMTDYLRREILARVSPTRKDFLVRSSILDTFCGGLCDDVLEIDGSAVVIESLETANLPIVPLDRIRLWYRYHDVFRRFLASELRTHRPDEIEALHRRASAWFESNGDVENAIRHAQKANDAASVLRLVAMNGREYFSTGRIETVLGWFRWFEMRGPLPTDVRLASTAGLAFALVGDVAAADRWSAVAFGGCDDAPEADLVPAGSLHMAMCGSCGAASLLGNPGTLTASAAGTDWYPAAAVLEGLALVWVGEEEAANDLLTNAHAAGDRYGGPTASSFARGLRASMALGRGEVSVADDLAHEAIATIVDHGLDGVATSGLPFAVAARAACLKGEHGRAASLLAHATTIRPFLTRALPGVSFQTLIELAKAHMQLADVAGAREMLRQIRDVATDPTRYGAASADYQAIHAQLEERPAGQVGASMLTTAELRVLPYLATHMTMPEIGERLFVSRNTVKSQAISIYRKLGVSSRSDAVETARGLGLLPD